MDNVPVPSDREPVKQRFVQALWYAFGRLDEASGQSFEAHLSHIKKGVTAGDFAAFALAEARAYHGNYVRGIAPTSTTLDSIPDQWRRYLDDRN